MQPYLIPALLVCGLLQQSPQALNEVLPQSPAREVLPQAPDPPRPANACPCGCDCVPGNCTCAATKTPCRDSCDCAANAITREIKQQAAEAQAAEVTRQRTQAQQAALLYLLYRASQTQQYATPTPVQVQPSQQLYYYRTVPVQQPYQYYQYTAPAQPSYQQMYYPVAAPRQTAWSPSSVMRRGTTAANC